MPWFDSTFRWRSLLELVSTVLLIVASIAVVTAVVLVRQDSRAQRRPVRTEPALPTAPISIEDGNHRGRDNAKVVLIEFSDFECPYCARYALEIHPEVNRRYVDTGRVLLVFRHLPLSIHKSAQKAAEAAECAGRQNRFWEMHDLLFQKPKELGISDLRRHAAQLALEPGEFDACLAGDMVNRVRADIEFAKSLGVTGTPTFLVGARLSDGTVRVTQRLRGAQSVESLQGSIEALLSRSPEK